MTAAGDTLARSGRGLARLAAVLPVLLVLVMVAAPALGHEQHSEGDGGTGDDIPTQQEGGGADSRTDEGHTGTADGEEAAGVPSPTPADMVVPAAAWGAIITIGGWVLLWRRTDTG